MTIHHFQAPHDQAWILLPDDAGSIRGSLTAVEARPDGHHWVCVQAGQWVRDGDDLAVQLVDLWAPLADVSVQEGSRGGEEFRRLGLLAPTEAVPSWRERAAQRAVERAARAAEPVRGGLPDDPILDAFG